MGIFGDASYNHKARPCLGPHLPKAHPLLPPIANLPTLAASPPRVIAPLAFALLIGFTLALLGTGGSIITLPVLVYGAGVPPNEAVGMSLAVVGGTCLAASVMNARDGLIQTRAALLFSLTGMLGAFAGAPFSHWLSPPVLMLLFASLMVTVALLMLRQRADAAPGPDGSARWPVCAASGFGVGALTGFFGVGGGFLIVPAMVFFGRIPLKRAIATSLVVISANSLAGLASHWRQAPFDWRIASLFLATCLVGMAAGRHLAARLPVARLRRAFAWFVLAVAAFVIAKNRAVFA